MIPHHNYRGHREKNQVRRRFRGGGRGTYTGVELAEAPLASTGCGVVVPRVTSKGKEMKFSSVVLTTNFSSIKSSVALLDLASLIVAGTDLSQRIGRAIRLHFVAFSGQLTGGQSNTAADDERNVCRLSLFKANQGMTWNSGTYNPNTVLDRRIVPGLGKVYYDEILSLVPPGKDTTGYLPAACILSRRVVINTPVEYSGTSGGAVPISLLLVACSDSSVAPSPGFVNGTILVAFTDE